MELQGLQDVGGDADSLIHEDEEPFEEAVGFAEIARELTEQEELEEALVASGALENLEKEKPAEEEKQKEVKPRIQEEEETLPEVFSRQLSGEIPVVHPWELLCQAVAAHEDLSSGWNLEVLAPPHLAQEETVEERWPLPNELEMLLMECGLSWSAMLSGAAGFALDNADILDEVDRALEGRALEGKHLASAMMRTSLFLAREDRLGALAAIHHALKLSVETGDLELELQLSHCLAELAPLEEGAILRVARLLKSLNQPEEREEWLEKNLQRWLNLGQFAQVRRLWESLNQEGLKSQRFLRLGLRSMLGLEQLEKALDVSDRCLVLYEPEFEDHELRAQILKGSGRSKEAAKELEKGSLISENPLGVLERALDLARQARDTDMILRLCGRIEAIYPDHEALVIMRKSREEERHAPAPAMDFRAFEERMEKLLEQKLSQVVSSSSSAKKEMERPSKQLEEDGFDAFEADDDWTDFDAFTPKLVIQEQEFEELESEEAEGGDFILKPESLGRLRKIEELERRLKSQTSDSDRVNFLEEARKLLLDEKGLPQERKSWLLQVGQKAAMDLSDPMLRFSWMDVMRNG